MERGPKLLVSVRSTEEARSALAGSADVIDIKEPDRGSLGRASVKTIDAILGLVGGRRPVSAALGELAEETPPIRDRRLTFVKSGLAGFRSLAWKDRLESELTRRNPQTVVVAYADWQCAQAPPVDEVVAFACEHAGNVLLIDTYCKEPGSLRKDRRPTLLDWLSVPEIVDICAECRAAGVRVALAGSLGFPEMEELRIAKPNWFAVRGAVCTGNDRATVIDERKVRELAQFLAKIHQSHL